MEQALFQKSPNVHGRIPGQSFFQIADMQKQLTYVAEAVSLERKLEANHGTR